MKSDYDILEMYINKKIEKEFFDSLSLEEQVLYKCIIRDTYSFIFYKLYLRFNESIDKLKTIVKIRK